VITPIIILASTLAAAQGAENGKNTNRTAKRAGTVEEDLPLKREYRFESNVRVRYLSVPGSIMDIWFFDNDSDGANPYARPDTRAFAAGAEFVLKKDPANWIFYFEYIGSMLDEGYWDDVEKPAAHDDGDWIRPDGLGMLAFGVNFGHEIYATPWMSFLFGGGLGLGFVLGDMTSWGPGGSNANDDCMSESPAYTRKDYCPDDGPKDLPNVLPVVDLTASARFHFADQANLRIDVGLHNMLYVGTAFGAVF
jgi:hypothetical protein